MNHINTVSSQLSNAGEHSSQGQLPEISDELQKIREVLQGEMTSSSKSEEKVESVPVDVTFDPSPQNKDGTWHMEVTLDFPDEGEIIKLIIPSGEMNNVVDELDAKCHLGKETHETWFRHFAGMEKTTFITTWNMTRDAQGKILLPKVLDPFFSELITK